MQWLVALARDAISDALFGTTTIDRSALEAAHETLLEPAATFVTLTKHGGLRGCIGSIIAHRPLFDDVVHNARAAAFEDPRFAPLDPDEWADVRVEVSLLTPPKLFEYASIEELFGHVTHRHGVILKHGYHQATFLPQVWEELPTHALFFAHLCQKAGLASSCLADRPEIYLYEVQSFKE